MPNQLQVKGGAQPSRQPKYGVLWHDNFYLGIVTQKNPLHSYTQHIEAEFYGSQPSLCDGLNTEISTKLTIIRRPGASVYNSQSFPPINRFYGFNPVINNQEQIHVIADVQAQASVSVTLNISSVQVVHRVSPPTSSTITVTFTTAPPPLQSFQTYLFSGLTNYPLLNGLSLQPHAVVGNTTSFYIVPGGGFPNYGPTADTGVAVVSAPSPDDSPTVRDVTGAYTYHGITRLDTNNILWTKSPSAGVTSFLGVGNTLYASDGVSAHKFTESPIIWTATTQYTSNQFIVDPNGNIQLSVGGQAATVSNIQIAGGTCTLFFTPGTSLTVPVGAQVSLSGLTTVPSLNGTTQTVTGTSNTQQIQFANAGSQAYSVETGQATTGTGFSGSSTPTWLTTLGAVTIDGGAQWVNSGPQVQTWGITAPTQAPTVTQTAAPSAYSSWTANTWYAPLFVILDTNGNLQQLTSVGSSPYKTGGSAPTWSVITGGTTTDGNVTWTCLGTGAWVANHAYAVGAVVQATFTYYITETQQNGYDQDGNPIYTTYQQPVTADCLFACTTAGTSGTSTPSWTNGINTTTPEGTVTWTNLSGPTIPGWPGATQILSLATAILDTNNNVQKVQVLGESGGSAPTWQTAVGSYTGDNTTYWLNSGPYGSGNTGAWIYAYSFENSVTGTISTASPESAPIIVKAGNLAVIQGAGSTDPQVDNIVIWRTVQGGSQLFYLDTIPNPGTSTNAGSWIYTDTTPDTSLNEFIEAPIDGVNNPPPTGLTALAYHLERIWGAVNNLVYFSTGPDVTAGNGNESWSASNVFAFPDTVIRLFPTSSGLFVFTTADIFIIQGLATTASPLFSTPLVYAFGLASYDAFSVNGTIVYAYTSDNQVVSLDPNAGITEIGFPIGDQFGPNNGTGTFLPANTQVTWHSAQSQDKGLYVSDFTGTWWRLCPTPSPETGWTWSPKAQIVGGFSAVQSIETTPGIRNLLMGPQTYGPILTRNYNVYSDNGSAYPSYAVLGSLVLAQPGQLAHVPFITTDSVAIGTAPTLAVQIDEIAPLSAGYFETLSAYVPDPTQLTAPLSVYAQRFYLSQTQKPAVCRHMQIQINWGSADTVRNELLSLTVFGGWEQEK